MNKPVVLLAALVIATFPSCAGYQLGSSKPHQLANVTKLAVPTFKNETLEPRLEVLVTNALIKKLQMDGAYQIVPREQADAVLVASIDDIERSQFRAVRTNTLRSSEILNRLYVKYTVQDSAGNKLLEGREMAYSNLVLDANVQLSERQALADAAERLGASLESRISEGW